MAHIPPQVSVSLSGHNALTCLVSGDGLGWTLLLLPSANKNCQTLPHQAPKIIIEVGDGRVFDGRVLQTEPSSSTSREVQYVVPKTFKNKIKICSCPDGITGLGLMM